MGAIRLRGFAKDLNLNILLDAELPKLRDTIRQGLLDGQWDLKMGIRHLLKPQSNPSRSLERSSFLNGWNYIVVEF